MHFYAQMKIVILLIQNVHGLPYGQNFISHTVNLAQPKPINRLMLLTFLCWSLYLGSN